MGRAVAAIGGAAGDIDDPSAGAPVAPVQDRAAAEIGAGLQVDLQRARPGVGPVVERGVDRHRLEHARVVHEHIDMAFQALQGGLPEPVARAGLGQVDADGIRPVTPAVPDPADAARLQRLADRSADPARRAGNKDAGR